jgi:metal-responsive CopG/Arc/MetJ family transcriptional regulator
MANKVITSISLPTEILKEAEKIAKEKHQSRSEFIKEAVLQSIDEHQWKTMQEAAAPYAAAQGVRTEQDVETLVREIRESTGTKA